MGDMGPIAGVCISRGGALGQWRQWEWPKVSEGLDAILGYKQASIVSVVVLFYRHYLLGEN